MQYEYFLFKKNDAVLDFKFLKDEKLEKKKADFLQLLKDAIVELEK